MRMFLPVVRPIMARDRTIIKAMKPETASIGVGFLLRLLMICGHHESHAHSHQPPNNPQIPPHQWRHGRSVRNRGIPATFARGGRDADPGALSLGRSGDDRVDHSEEELLVEGIESFPAAVKMLFAGQNQGKLLIRL